MLAIIPARGGSKRLPRKNIKLLNGKPLIAYTIDSALNSPSINKVVVSTDDVEIADIAKEIGAEVPFLRPEFLSTDSATSNDVIKYTLEMLGKMDRVEYKDCVLLQPTSPFRKSNEIESAISLFLDKEAESVISICKEKHPISWHKTLNEDLQIELMEIETNRITYYPNGAIYVLSNKVIESGQYYTNRTFGYIMDSIASLDIDTIEDWDYAEFLIGRKV